jgi:single-strand DNA-binding protein
MASYDLTGKVKLIMDLQTFDSGFTKREFVVTTEEEYPQDVKFECIKDKCSLLDSYSVGQTVKVSFNLRGNEYKERYFVNLQAWRMEAADADMPEPSGDAASATSDRPPLDTYQEPAENLDDVLPF